MDTIIFNGDFNDRYINNATCIGFHVYVISINIEEIYRKNHASCLLSGEPIGSYETILTGCSAIIIFQERDRVVINPVAIV